MRSHPETPPPRPRRHTAFSRLGWFAGLALCGLALALTAGGGDDGETLKDANKRGDAALKRGNYAEAARQFARAVPLAEKRFGADDIRTAGIRIALGQALQQLGRYAEAEAPFRRALAIVEKAHGPDHPDVALCLANLGALDRLRGRYVEAEPPLRRALAILEKADGPDAPNVATVCNSLAVLFIEQGRFAEAEDQLRRAVRIAEAAGGKHADLGSILANLAGLYEREGRYAEAGPLFRRALQVWQGTLGPNHPRVAHGYTGLGRLYERQGRYAEAEPLYKRALELYEQGHGPDHPFVVVGLTNLAGLYVWQRRYAAAEPLYRRALNIRESGDPNAPAVAVAVANLARLYEHQRRYAAAEPLQRRALQILEDRLPANHPDLAGSLLNLAETCLRQGKLDDAGPLFRRAVRNWESRLDPGHPDVALARDGLARWHAASGKWAESAALFDQTLRDLRRPLRITLAPLGPPEQLSYLARNVHPKYHAALGLAVDRRADAGMAERAAGWLLNVQGLTQEALAEPLLLARAGQTPELRGVYRELLGVRGRAAFLANAAATGRAKPKRDELEQILQRERELTERLAQGARGSAQSGKWVELAELRRALPADAVFVAFARHGVFDFTRHEWAPARYLACVVPPAGKGEVRLLDLGPARAIDAAVRDVRRSLAESPRVMQDRGEPAAEQTLQTPLQRLAELVLAPLHPYLKGSPRWVVGPDAALWLVPFELLPLPDGRYAVEAHTFRYVTSGRDLLADAPAPKQPGPALVLADPDYDGPAPADAAPFATRGRPTSADPLPRFARLPGTAQEAADVAPALKHLTRAEPVVKTGRAASEGVVKTAKGPRFLLLSTHGFFLPDQDAAAPTLFAAFPQEVLTRTGKPLENPLLRCGLALAGANRPGPLPDGAEDGILTGLEVLGCDLAGTELVVLSACETGVGQLNVGEGVAGLRQAFHLAGARAVLASLWHVPDRPTAELMAAFFAELEKGGDTAAALRRAQLRLIRQRRALDGAAHPFFWAAFTLTARGTG